MKIDGVFEGGGVRGIAPVGAICALAEKGYEWERVAGTSAGAIIAALLAAGYSCSELKTIITDIDYNKFTKKTFIDKIPFIGKGLSAWLFVRPPQTTILPFSISFSWGWS